MYQSALLSLVLFLTFLKAYGEEKVLDPSEPDKAPLEFRQDQNPDNNTITVTATVRGGAQALPAGSADDISMGHSRNAPVRFWGESDSDSLADAYSEQKVLDPSEPDKAPLEFRQDQNPENNTVSVTTTVRGQAR